MTRAQGFARGDLDTAFPLDDKFLALRSSTDGPTYYAATGVYFHIVAATWREAERKPATRITPDAAPYIAHLVRVGLLDGDECIPRRAYGHSVGRALRARKAATDRKSRNRSGMSRGTDSDTRGSHAVSTDIQSRTEQIRSVPSVQSRPAHATGATNGGSKEPRRDPEVQRMLDLQAAALRERGLAS